MTYLSSNRFDVRVGGVWPVIRAALSGAARIAGNALARRRNRLDYQHLMDLPDYLLDDVGVSRTSLRNARASAGAGPRRSGTW